MDESCMRMYESCMRIVRESAEARVNLKGCKLISLILATLHIITTLPMKRQDFSVLGNTFNGRLLEFNQVGVDRFNIDADIFLLTHIHKDHLVGLSNKSFKSPVYCSELTKQLLALEPEYRLVLPFLRGIAFNCPITINLPNDEPINLTLIPSYHCPGSTLFLVEGCQKSILFTGDIRAESWWIESLKKNAYLAPYICGSKPLDNIYLDTTFGYRGEPYIEMPPNDEGISAVVKLLLLYPRDDPDIQVLFKDYVFGFEEAWAHIVSSLGGSLHVSDELVKMRNGLLNANNCIVPYGQLLNKVLHTNNKDELKLKFHVCHESSCMESVKFKVSVKQCINFNIMDFVSSLLPISISQITPDELQELHWVDQTSKGYQIYEFRNRRWLKVTDELLPSDIKLVFSRHSCYNECKRFVELFRPLQVYPLVEDSNSWANGFIMSRIFGNVCSLNTFSRFSYDVKNSCCFGLPHVEMLLKPVKLINRWKFDQCENELQFVEAYLNTSDNQSNTRTQLINKFNGSSSTTLKSPNLSDIINDRYDPKYTIFIEKSRLLYKKYLTMGLPGQKQTGNYLQDLHNMDNQSFYCSTYSFLSSSGYSNVSVSLTSNEKDECDLKDQCDFQSQRSTYADSMKIDQHDMFQAPKVLEIPGDQHEFTEEFGVATRIPTVVDNENIESSMNSIEVCLCRKPSKRRNLWMEINDKTINKITKRLKQNPDNYFEFELSSLRTSR